MAADAVEFEQLLRDQSSVLRGRTLDNTPSVTLRGRRVLAKVLDVYDGDTLTVAAEVVPGAVHALKVRVAKIDTCEIRDADPEKRRLAVAARDRVVNLILSSYPSSSAADAPQFRKRRGGLFSDNECYVLLTGYGNDKYGRSLCDVTLPGAGDLGQILLSEGLARRYCVES